MMSVCFHVRQWLWSATVLLIYRQLRRPGTVYNFCNNPAQPARDASASQLRVRTQLSTLLGTILEHEDNMMLEGLKAEIFPHYAERRLSTR